MAYGRVLVKLSGEALAGKKGFGIDEKAAIRTAEQIAQIANEVEVAVVVGGGNLWRGRSSEEMDRVTADQIGMLATLMNAMALCDALATVGVRCGLSSSISVDKVVRASNIYEDSADMEQGVVVVYGCGTGEPFFSTDTAAVLRACELGCDAVLCAKAVDGIYDSDPKTNPNAKKYDEISYDKVIADNLKALDLTAIAMAREYNMPVVCFGKDEKDGLLRVVRGEKLGTVVRNPQ